MKQYLIGTSLLNLGWEILQLPLYTLWTDSSGPDIAFAVVHCTVGDMVIALFSLLFAVLLAGTKEWPRRRFRAVALTTVLFGLLYTVYSEWNNTVVTQSWAYSALMPQIGGIGLSPLAQWVVIPSFIFWKMSPKKASQ